MTDPLEAIKNLVNQATTAASQVRWLMCRDCGNVLEHDMATIPAASPCPDCGAAFNRVTFSMKELANSKSAELKLSKGAVINDAAFADVVSKNAIPAAPVPAAPVPAAPVAAPEKLEPAAAAEPKTRRGRASKATEVPAAPVAEAPKPEPQTHSAPVLAPAVVEMPENLFPAEMTPEDWAKKRADEKAAFIAKLGLNVATWTPCGHGRLFTTGFWSKHEDGHPFIDWNEIHDTPQSFAARHAEARTRDSRTVVDQGLINDLSPELAPVAYRGTVSASLRQVLAHCSIRPTYGCRVALAAKLTESGNISFQVTAVSK